ncbi:MAG: hypothetical protein E1N59_2580 [Puniceicoccaceae bacterium 5H]|nr:MAG: hypothetical protein E1N59_2580 [Puniceicoccaceae bacterium 5H]
MMPHHTPFTWWRLLLLLPPLAAQGQSLLYEDFEDATPGDQPEASASPRPLRENIGATVALPVTPSEGGPIGIAIAPYSGSPATNYTGEGQYLRMWDYDTGVGLGLEYNFVDSAAEQISLLHFALDFASTSAALSSSENLRISLGEFYDQDKINLSRGSNRPFMLRLSNDGQIELSMTDADSVGGTFSTDASHHLDIFINDYEDQTFLLPFNGDDQQLYTNSVTVFLDGVFFGQAMLDNTLNYRLQSGNFGRLGFVSTTATVGVDFLVDNLEINELSLTADPTPVPWPGDDPDLSGDEGEDYDLVLLDERFDYKPGPLNRISRWAVSTGSPELEVDADGTVDFATGDDTVDGHYSLAFYDSLQVKRAPVGDEPGPRVYLRTDLRLDGSVAGLEATPLMGLQNGDIADRVTGLVWVREGSTADSLQLGLSLTDTADDIQWSPVEISDQQWHTLVVRKSYGTNDRALWLDPADTEATPDLTVAVEKDTSDSSVAGVALLDTAGDMALSLDNLRVSGSFAMSLDRTPVERPQLSVTQNVGDYTVDAADYFATFTGNLQLTRLAVSGEDLLYSGDAYPAGGYWNVVSEGSIGKNVMLGDQYFVMQTEYVFSSVAARVDGMTLMLQNNDEDNAATYALVFDRSMISSVVNGEGNEVAVTADVSAVSELALSTDYNTLQLRGVTGVYADATAGALVVEARMEPREVRSIELYPSAVAVTSPLEYQVFQRETLEHGQVEIAGRALNDADTVVVTFSGGTPLAGALPTDPVNISIAANGDFAQSIELPAGGWYQADLSFQQNGTEVAQETISRFGVGEVFVGAGQSNSTNSGTEPTTPESDLAVSFSGGHWQPAADPQPGVHDLSTKGSYYPAFLDDMAAELQVPVAIASTGHGGTSVERWQPDYPYNYDSYLSYARYNGLYPWTLYRLGQLGQGGFRAVLWHQGESDSSHEPGVVRTSHEDYYHDLKNLIESTRTETAWDIPWFVAQASVWPLDNPNGDPEISGAQQQIWADGIALPGANSDTLGLEFRQPDGSRVHFTPEGLAAHAALWSEILLPYVEQQGQSAVWLEQNMPGAEVLEGTNWAHVGGFDWVWTESFPWIWQDAWGWLWVSGNTDGWWMYHPEASAQLGWLWTSGELYPLIYADEIAQWTQRDGDSLWLFGDQRWMHFDAAN